MNMADQPKIQIRLTCVSCRWENEVKLEEMGMGMTVEPCKDHGVHSSVILSLDCPQCHEVNQIIIES